MENLPKKRERKEGKIQDKIIKYLRELSEHNDCQFGLTNFMSSFNDAGWPDITGNVKGLFVAIEVKEPKGRQSRGQVTFQERCDEIGGVYMVVKSLDDVKRELKKFNIN